MILALWHCRLWFVYPVIIVSVFKTSSWFSKRALGNNGTPILALGDSSTWEGYIMSVIATFAVYTICAQKMTQI